MSDPALLAEAYRRGLLPPEQKAAYEEAQRRGLLNPPKPSLADEVTGGLANLNRGLVIGDEIAGATQGAVFAVQDALAGRPQLGIVDRFKQGMAAQRATEDQFDQRRPLAAAGARGTGNAASVLLPGGQIARGGSLAANAVRAGAVAAPQGFAAGFLDRGDLGQRMATGNTGAWLGAGLGLGVGAAASRFAGRPPVAENQTAALAAVRELGLDPNQLTPEARQRMLSLVADGYEPKQAAIAAMGDTLPVRVPLTRGNMSQSPIDQLAESLALRGAKGQEAQTIARGAMNDKQAAIRENVSAIADQMAGGTAPTGGQGAAMVQQRLAGEAEQAAQGVRKAYEAARAAPGGLAPDAAMAFGTRVESALETFDRARVPAVAREVDRLKEITFGPNSLKGLFDSRARLSALSSSSDAVEAAAARSAKKAFDAEIARAVDEDLMTGDAAAVRLWQTAIKARRDMGSVFQAGDLIETLTAREPRSGQMMLKVAPEDAANVIFGRSALGMAGKANLSRDLRRLQSVLGPKSPEWNALRAEAFQRLAFAADRTMDGGTPQFSGTVFAKNWREFQAKSPELANTLFTAQERAQLNQLSAVASRATSVVRGGDNPSNTAVAAARLLGNLPIVKQLAPFFRFVPEGVDAAMTKNAMIGAKPAMAPVEGAYLPQATRAAGVYGGTSANGQPR